MPNPPPSLLHLFWCRSCGFSDPVTLSVWKRAPKAHRTPDGYYCSARVVEFDYCPAAATG